MQKSGQIQLTPISGYDVKNLIFSEPVESNVPNSVIKGQRISISTTYPDGSVGPLILPTSRLFSFGVSENKSQETQETNGWSLPLCLYSRDGPSHEEKEWVTTFNNIVDACVDHLVEVGPELGLEYTKAELTKTKGGLNPLYWKREKVTDEKTGKPMVRIVPGTGPTLYPKLIYSKKNDKFLSKFYGMDDQPIDPLTLLGKYCYAEAGVKIEGFYIGAKTTLQIKLYEAVVELSQSSMTRLMHAPRPKSNSTVLEYRKTGDTKVSNPLAGGDDQDDGSIGSDVDTSPKKAAPKPVKTDAAKTDGATVVRKVNKVVPKAKAKAPAK